MDGVGGGTITTAIAIDKDKNSQYAVKWALENVVVDDMSCVVLLHVLTQTTLPDEAGIGKDGRPPTEAERQQFFQPFSSLCALKGVTTKEVVLKDSDASNALVLYVTRNAITHLVVGSRSRLTRAFKNVASSLQRSLPDTCNLYSVSKSKNQKLKSAIQSPAPNNTLSVSTKGTHSSSEEVDLWSKSKCNSISGAIGFGKTPFARSIARRVGHDDFTVMAPPPRDGLLASRTTVPRELHDFNANLSCKILDKSLTSNVYISSQNADDLDDETWRVKLEVKKAMDMYHSACKDATNAKQNETEIYQQMPAEAAEAAKVMLEMEKQKSKAAIEAAQKAQLLAELESQRRKKAELKAEHEASERKKLILTSTQSNIQYRKYTIEDIEIATDYFSNTLKIGEGGYGPVFRGNLDHIFVAIKVLRPDISQGETQFQKEVEVLTCIRHPHMVLLMGACPEYGCLIYEYMENGSLEDRLFRKNNTAVLPWSLRFKICTEIATALHFLHQTRPQPLVHRDLKPGNILLDRNFVSKISDVGLARLVPPEVADDAAQYHHITAAAGTFCYIDPEYQQTGILGTKSDIYSFGVILLQVITGKSPMGLTHQVSKAIKEGKFVDVVDPAVTDWPVEETLCLAQLGLQCCDMRKKGRPDLGSVILPELKRLRDLGDSS